MELDADRDRWFTADAAKEYGFIDHVVAREADVDNAGKSSVPPMGKSE